MGNVALPRVAGTGVWRPGAFPVDETDLGEVRIIGSNGRGEVVVIYVEKRHLPHLQTQLDAVRQE